MSHFRDSVEDIGSPALQGSKQMCGAGWPLIVSRHGLKLATAHSPGWRPTELWHLVYRRRFLYCQLPAPLGPRLLLAVFRTRVMWFLSHRGTRSGGPSWSVYWVMSSLVHVKPAGFLQSSCWVPHGGLGSIGQDARTSSTRFLWSLQVRIKCSLLHCPPFLNRALISSWPVFIVASISSWLPPYFLGRLLSSHGWLPSPLTFLLFRPAQVLLFSFSFFVWQYKYPM
jgi:hypothetical protein